MYTSNSYMSLELYLHTSFIKKFAENTRHIILTETFQQNYLSTWYSVWEYRRFMFVTVKFHIWILHPCSKSILDPAIPATSKTELWHIQGLQG
jgi:hypothetical protein